MAQPTLILAVCIFSALFCLATGVLLSATSVEERHRRRLKKRLDHLKAWGASTPKNRCSRLRPVASLSPCWIWSPNSKSWNSRSSKRTCIAACRPSYPWSFSPERY